MTSYICYLIVLSVILCTYGGVQVTFTKKGREAKFMLKLISNNERR